MVYKIPPVEVNLASQWPNYRDLSRRTVNELIKIEKNLKTLKTPTNVINEAWHNELKPNLNAQSITFFDLERMINEYQCSLNERPTCCVYSLCALCD